MSNIVKWIYDEKEARSYLETVANNLSHEIQMLKEQPTLTNSLPNGQKSDWQTLRQKKKNNQQLLELQSALQEELQRREALFKGKLSVIFSLVVYLFFQKFRRRNLEIRLWNRS